MIEIIPNWHPIFVHFTVALVVASALFFIFGFVMAERGWSEPLKTAGHWTLRLGAVFTLFTLAAGLQAYGSVSHDTPSHAAMTDHRNWAFATVGLIWLSAVWSVWISRNGQNAGILFLALLAVATILVGATAYKGGELVYRYGLGVQSLPKPEGDGHDHDHGDVSTQDKSFQEGPEDDHAHEATENSALPSDPAITADAFHLALKMGDAKAVEQLLAEDVVILESGHAQHSREEYMSGHMKSDMAFLPDIEREVTNRKSSQSGKLAWVITHSRMFGEYKGQAIDMSSREMLVMRHEDDRWQITLVHWGDK